jgi:hypothetical protein
MANENKVDEGQVRREVARLIKRLGVRGAARALGISRTATLGLGSSAPVQRGSVLLAAEGLAAIADHGPEAA